MKEKFKNIPLIGERLNSEESQEIIKDLREKYPDIDIDEDIEHFIITTEEDGKEKKVTFLKRKFLPTTNEELPRLPIEEALEAEIIGTPEQSMFEKVKNLREKNKEEKEKEAV